MNINLFSPLKSALMVGILFCTFSTQAITYTAIASGDYFDTAIWQDGIVPRYLLIDESLVIPAGITVTKPIGGFTMYSTSAAGTLTVDGTFRVVSQDMDLYDVTINGSGTIEANIFRGEFAHGFDFSGTLSANSLFGSNLVINNGTTLNVADALFISGEPMVMNNGQLNIANNATIVIHGTQLIPPPLINIGSNAVLNLPSSYDVEYRQGGTQAGIELTGSGLRNVKVDVGYGSEVRLLDDFIVDNAELDLVSGSLALNNHKLFITQNGNITATPDGYIKGTALSEIAIDITSHFTGHLNFFKNFDTLRKLSINTPNNVLLASTMKIIDTLELQSGKLNISSNTLTLLDDAVVSGASPDRYIIVERNNFFGGGVEADIKPGTPTTYPIGTQLKYAPCTLTNRADSTYQNFRVGVYDEVRTLGFEGNIISDKQPLVNVTWFLDEDKFEKVDLDVTLMWNGNMEANSFNRGKAYIAQMTDATWKKSTPAAAATISGMYALAKEGVKYSSALAVFDETTVDVNDISSHHAIAVYPNPAIDIIHVDVNTNVTATIFSTTGQTISATVLDKKANKIDISTLSPGMYYIQLTGEGINETISIIKK